MHFRPRTIPFNCPKWYFEGRCKNTQTAITVLPFTYFTDHDFDTQLVHERIRSMISVSWHIPLSLYISEKYISSLVIFLILKHLNIPSNMSTFVWFGRVWFRLTCLRSSQYFPWWISHWNVMFIEIKSPNHQTTDTTYEIVRSNLIGNISFWE